tara:strand:+ start:421 stop:708 length:288 start_codon:yes stop_codon:yes gene_type:complete
MPQKKEIEMSFPITNIETINDNSNRCKVNYDYTLYDKLDVNRGSEIESGNNQRIFKFKKNADNCEYTLLTMSGGSSKSIATSTKEEYTIGETNFT